MSVLSHLSNTASSLVLSDREKHGIDKSESTLAERLNYYFLTDIKTSFRFGSYERGTILPRSVDSKSDVDYMVVFDNEDGYKPQTYLNKLRRFANFRYSTSEVEPSHPTIVLNLNHIRFELVPAVRLYNITTTSLRIPSPTSDFMEWMPTDPHQANKNVRDHNTANLSLSKPLIRLLKYWNCQMSPRPFSSFEIENHVTSMYFYGCINIKDYFYTAVDHLPQGHEKSQSAQAKIKRLQETISKVKEYESSLMPLSALTELKNVIPSI